MLNLIENTKKLEEMAVRFPIYEEVIERCKDILSKFIISPMISPLCDYSGIQLEWENEKGYIELVIQNDNFFSILVMSECDSIFETNQVLCVDDVGKRNILNIVNDYIKKYEINED